MLWLAFVLTFQHSVREDSGHLAIFLSNSFSNEITCNAIISYHWYNIEINRKSNGHYCKYRIFLEFLPR